METQGTVTESIFDGQTTTIPMADVQHTVKHWFPSDNPKTRDNYRGITVITKHTTYDTSSDYWANAIYLDRAEADAFTKAWMQYRHELESRSLSSLSPKED